LAVLADVIARPPFSFQWRLSYPSVLILDKLIKRCYSLNSLWHKFVIFAEKEKYRGFTGRTVTAVFGSIALPKVLNSGSLI